MTAMESLTSLKGIGAKTAKALVAAGISTRAALATLDPAAPPEVPGLSNPDWPAWIAAALDAAPPLPDTAAFLVVVGPKKGRWRAGWHFGADPVCIPLADLSEDEKVAIEGDPVLKVRLEPALPA